MRLIVSQIRPSASHPGGSLSGFPLHKKHRTSAGNGLVLGFVANWQRSGHLCGFDLTVGTVAAPGQEGRAGERKGGRRLGTCQPQAQRCRTSPIAALRPDSRKPIPIPLSESTGPGILAPWSTGSPIKGGTSGLGSYLALSEPATAALAFAPVAVPPWFLDIVTRFVPPEVQACAIMTYPTRDEPA